MSRGLISAGILAIGLALLAFQLTSNIRKNRTSEIPLSAVQAFSGWAITNNQKYNTPAERKYRLSVFLQNKNFVDSHNKDESKSYSMAINHLADLTEEEFKSKYLTSKPFSHEEAAAGAGINIKDPNYHTPHRRHLQQQTNFDLLNYLQQTTISTSPNCNDNYAWISAIAMNANYYLSRGSRIQYQFSPQTYLDCSANFGNRGCADGSTIYSFQYSQTYGIDTLGDYPYYGVPRACRATTGLFRNSGYKIITPLSNQMLYQELSSRRNVITAYVDLASARFYQGGVFQGPCTTTTNQGVLLVGAGVDPMRNLPYWLLLNTWGPMWGENGKMRIARFADDGSENTSSCGLTKYAAYPTF